MAAVAWRGRLRLSAETLTGDLGARTPPGLAGFRKSVDGIVVLVLAGKSVHLRGLQRGAVVFRPVGDAALAIIAAQLVHPALSDKGHVADNPRRGEARQVTH